MKSSDGSLDPSFSIRTYDVSFGGAMIDMGNRLLSSNWETDCRASVPPLGGSTMDRCKHEDESQRSEECVSSSSDDIMMMLVVVGWDKTTDFFANRIDDHENSG